MDIEETRAEMRRAVRYRSGPGLINTVYLGSMATHGLRRRLGDRSGSRLSGQSLDDLIVNARPHEVVEAYEYSGYQWILKLYRKAGSKLYRYETKAIETE